jgi:hypothetical protein
MMETADIPNRISYLTWSLTPALAYYKALKLRALLRQEVLATLLDGGYPFHPKHPPCVPLRAYDWETNR